MALQVFSAATIPLLSPSPLSPDTGNRLMIATTSQQVGQELINALNNGGAGGVAVLVAIVLDANSSTTSNLTAAQLLPGDLVFDLTTVANNIQSSVVTVTAGTIAYTPSAGDCLLVLRPGAATRQTIS